MVALGKDSLVGDPVASQESHCLAVGWHRGVVQRVHAGGGLCGLLHHSHNMDTTSGLSKSYQLSHLSPRHCPDKRLGRPLNLFKLQPSDSLSGTVWIYKFVSTFLGQACSETSNTHETAQLLAGSNFKGDL